MEPEDGSIKGTRSPLPQGPALVPTQTQLSKVHSPTLCSLQSAFHEKVPAGGGGYGAVRGERFLAGGL
jgi:hypothetical protein